MKSCKIAIIDSGVRTDHPAFINKKIIGYSLEVNMLGEVVKSDNFYDTIGHGTAIFYLIDKFTTNCHITNIKIYNDETDIDSNKFELILDYIYKNDHFDIINISMGIVNYGNTKSLQQICNKFTERGTIIVSAFDNNGAVSFPAALENVIGVDAQDIELEANEYIFVENSIVNIIGKSCNMRVAWTTPDYIIVKGSSFVCAKVTARIAEEIKSQKSFCLENICSKKQIFEKNKITKMNFSINRAVIFPFNKEIHAIARYEDLLNFNIVDYYTSRITGQVGKKNISNTSKLQFFKSTKKY